MLQKVGRNKQMLIICGKTSTGKTSCGNELELLGYKKIITYSSRPIREGEIDGIDYHFVSMSKFLELYNDGFFVEARPYQTPKGTWWYGSAKEDYAKADDNTYVILNPDGVKRILTLELHNVKTVLIDATEEEIRRRQKLRGDSDDDYERRLQSDMRDFKDMDKLVDFIVYNDCLSLYGIAMIVDNWYKKEMKI